MTANKQFTPTHRIAQGELTGILVNNLKPINVFMCEATDSQGKAHRVYASTLVPIGTTVRTTLTEQHHESLINILCNDSDIVIDRKIARRIVLQWAEANNINLPNND